MIIINRDNISVRQYILKPVFLNHKHGYIQNDKYKHHALIFLRIYKSSNIYTVIYFSNFLVGGKGVIYENKKPILSRLDHTSSYRLFAGWAEYSVAFWYVSPGHESKSPVLIAFSQVYLTGNPPAAWK